MGLYRAFHRSIRRYQELRIQVTGVHEAVIGLKESAVFKPVGVACVLAMARSRGIGANLPRKKASVISKADEVTILNHSCTSMMHPRGLQKRAAYYMLTRFCIRGGTELYNLLAHDFTFGVDEVSRYVRYDEQNSKNYRVSMGRYQEEHFRPAITEYDCDVIETLDRLKDHLPTSVPAKERFLFYAPIDNPRSQAWYSSSRVAKRNLAKWLKLMHEESGLISDGVTNKSGRTTCVTRMSAEGVPPVVGMLLTGHKNAGSYARYDRASEAKVRAAQRSVAEGTSFTTNMEHETAIMRDKVISGHVEGMGKLKRKVDEGNCSRTMSEGREKQVAPPTARPAPAPGAGTVHQPLPAECVQQRLPAECGVHAVPGSEVVDDPVIAAPDGQEVLTVQSTEDYDEWAALVNWDAVDTEIASRLVVAKTINTNPITAVFGKIQCMTNCQVTINMGHGNEPTAGFITDVIGNI